MQKGNKGFCVVHKRKFGGWALEIIFASKAEENVGCAKLHKDIWEHKEERREKQGNLNRTKVYEGGQAPFRAQAIPTHSHRGFCYVVVIL